MCEWVSDLCEFFFQYCDLCDFVSCSTEIYVALSLSVARYLWLSLFQRGDLCDFLSVPICMLLSVFQYPDLRDFLSLSTQIYVALSLSVPKYKWLCLFQYWNICDFLSFSTEIYVTFSLLLLGFRRGGPGCLWSACFYNRLIPRVGILLQWVFTK